MPTIREALRQLSSLGLPMIVISNKAGLGKGLLKPDAHEEITARMRQTLLSGAPVAAVYYCPHTREED